MKKVSMIISLVVILGFGAMAFAGNGNGSPGGNGNGSPGINGNGGPGCNGNGEEYHNRNGEQGKQGICPSPCDRCGPGLGCKHMGHGCKQMGPGFKQMGFGFMLGNLSEEERELLFEARDVFREETEGIREDIHDKWEELRSALHGDVVDSEMVDELLKNLYDLKYAFAQMRLDHMLEMKALVGNFGEVITIAE